MSLTKKQKLKIKIVFGLNKGLGRFFKIV